MNLTFPAILSAIVSFVTSWGLKILAAVVVFLVGIKLISMATKWLHNSPKLSKMDSSLRSFLVGFSKIALYAVLVITVAMIVGIPAASFITVLASCGVAIGLALQGSLSNFAGGIMILFFKPFKVGDFIEAMGETGTVVEISVVYTELLTLDNRRITVPNGALTNSVMKNYSSEETRRVDLTFSASYRCDMQLVKDTIAEIVAAHPLVLQDPEPFIRMTSLSQNSIDYTVRVWTKGGDYWTVYMDLLEGVKKAFDEKGITVPYPQMDIHVDNK